MKKFDPRWQSVRKLAILKVASIELRIQSINKRIIQIEEENIILRSPASDNTYLEFPLVWERNYQWQQEKIKKNNLMIAELRSEILDVEQTYRQTIAQKSILKALLSKD